MAQEGPSPRRRRSPRRCQKARRAKRDRRASRLLISKETHHDNLREVLDGEGDVEGRPLGEEWLTARCALPERPELRGERDGERLSPGGLVAASLATLWSTAETRKSHTQLSNGPMRERERSCAKQTLQTLRTKRRWHVVHSTFLFLYDLFET